jgi:hypothetical protein
VQRSPSAIGVDSQWGRRRRGGASVLRSAP